MNAVLKRLRDVLLTILVAVLMKVLSNIGLLLTPWLAKYGLDLKVELFTLAGLGQLVAAAVIGAGLDWLFTRNVFVWVEAIIDKYSSDTKDVAGKLPLLLLVLIIPLGLLGCADTPRREYRHGMVLYVAANAGATAAAKTGKLPADQVPIVREDLLTYGDSLAKLGKWIAANPKLADTPGATPAELSNAQAFANIVMGHVAKYALLAPIPPQELPPATQPTARP